MNLNLAPKKQLGFTIHPSASLHNLYKNKSYQGANPNDASVIFVGRDPNWAADIESMVMYHLIQEYLYDGISFWNKYGEHHPFLSTSYKGDGKRYHSIFSKLKVKSEYSNKISFVELLGFPTTGMAKKDNKGFRRLLLSEDNRNHLIQLNSLISDPDKVFFIAWGLMDDFKFLYDEIGLFAKFARLDKTQMDINDLNQSGNIFIHRHFSDAISNETINKMSERVNFYLR